MKIEKITFSFDDGQFLDWFRLPKPVLSYSGSKMFWKVSNGVDWMFTSGNPSVTFSKWLLVEFQQEQ